MEVCQNGMSLLCPVAYSLFVLQKELQVHLEDSLQQTHVCALVQANLMLPDVDNQNLTRCQGKEGTLSLKVLVFASLAAIGTLDVHNQDVVGQLDGAISGGFLLVLGHPYSLGSLPTFRLGHDTELGPEEVVQQGGLARGLGAEDGDEVVVEASLGDLGLDEVVVQMRAGFRVSVELSGTVAAARGNGEARDKRARDESD